MFEPTTSAAEVERGDLIDTMILEASEHYHHHSIPAAGEVICRWLRSFAEERKCRHVLADSYTTWMELCVLSAMQAGDCTKWVEPAKVVHMIQKAERYNQECKNTAIRKSAPYPPCPIYLQSNEEREYERLVCGALSHYRLCADIHAAPIVAWLEDFQTSLYEHNASQEQCKAVSSMYNCGTFVSAYQANNLAHRCEMITRNAIK